MNNMDILGSIYSAVVTIVGLVVYEIILAQFKDNIADVYGLLAVVPIIIAAVLLLVIVANGLGRTK